MVPLPITLSPSYNFTIELSLTPLPTFTLIDCPVKPFLCSTSLAAIVGFLGLTFSVTVPSEPEPVSSELVPSLYLAITLYLNIPALAVLVGLTSPRQLHLIPSGKSPPPLRVIYPAPTGFVGSLSVSPTVFSYVPPWIGYNCASGIFCKRVPIAPII